MKLKKVAKTVAKVVVGYYVIKGIAYLFCSPNYHGHHPFGL